MNNIVGQPVEGDDFFGREQETQALWEGLAEGNHAVLLAPRRVGKTSLAIRVGRQAVAAGWKFVLVDAQGDRDELGFLSNLVEKLRTAGLKLPALAHLAESVAWLRRNLPDKIGGWGVSLEINHAADKKETTSLEALVNRLFDQLEEGGARVLIAVDELPVLLTELDGDPAGQGRVRNFLNWFRALRLRYRKNVRWLLLGSVGLDSFVESRRLTPSINDLQVTTLGAYEDEVAVRFLQALGQGKHVDMPPEVCRAVIDQVGWPLPFFLQLMFQRLHAHLGRPPRTPTVADVAVAFGQLVSADFYKHFEPWRGRLADGLNPDELKAARAVLRALCVRPDGLPRPALHDAVAAQFPQRDSEEVAGLLAATLGLLERDGYLLRQSADADTPARYAFRSFLLRQYWFAREVA